MPEKTAVAEAPELSEAMPADSEEVKPEVPEGTEAEQPPETPAEAEKEAGEEEVSAEEAPKEEEEDLIAGLDPTVVDEVIRRRGPDSELYKESLRRERQSATDTQTFDQERLRAQQEDTDRVLQAGRTAIGQIGNIVAAAQKGAEDGEVRLDVQGLYRAIDDYRNAWVAGQGTTWNRELNEAYTGLDIVQATFGEPEAERLSAAMKAANRDNSRAPLLKEMFSLLVEKALVAGHGMGLDDIDKIAKHQKTLADKKDGLEKLKKAVPPSAPAGGKVSVGHEASLRRKYREGTGTAAEDAEARRLIADEERKR